LKKQLITTCISKDLAINQIKEALYWQGSHQFHEHVIITSFFA